LWKRALAVWSWIKAVFSGRDPKVTPLWKTVKPLLQAHPVEAWFWGHEHRLALYKATSEIVRPRLLGNGGIPSPVTDASYYTDAAAIVFDYEMPLSPGSSWCRFAFARVDLEGDGFSESYFDELGNPIELPD
jgi:hypothetical protein